MNPPSHHKNEVNSSMSVDELREQLAAIEHERWADWQAWVHKVSHYNDDKSLTIPPSLVERWNRQIATAYSELSDVEKASDMEQVDRYWNLIHQYVTKKQIEKLKDVRSYQDSARNYAGGEMLEFVSLEDIDDHIKELEKQLEGGK